MSAHPKFTAREFAKIRSLVEMLLIEQADSLRRTADGAGIDPASAVLHELWCCFIGHISANADLEEGKALLPQELIKRLREKGP